MLDRDKQIDYPEHWARVMRHSDVILDLSSAILKDKLVGWSNNARENISFDELSATLPLVIFKTHSFVLPCGNSSSICRS